MNKAQKQVQQSHLDEEKKVIRLLQIVYNQAKKDCEQKIRELSARTDLENLQSIVYQKQYQEALKKQLEGVLDDLHSKQFTSIADYLQNCYINGYVGNMYDLYNQGILLIIPIDQAQVVEALQTDSKLSNGLYKRLGEDVSYLKRSIRAELSRGISTGSSWNEIAVHIANGMNNPFDKSINSAIRIARTEGHRIQNKAALDAQYHAKEKGADIAKQWDATLDGHTRPSHRRVDGEIRELGERFSNGLMYPGDSTGTAAEVINCRCALLQRARWMLEGGFTKRDNFTGELRSFSSPEDYEEFKKWYFSKENVAYMNYVNVLEERYRTKDFNKLLEKMTDGEYNHFRKLEASTPMWREREKIIKSMNYAVESKMLNSRTYVEKFKLMTDDSVLRKEYLSNAKTMLQHRSGQNGEDLYLYNTITKRWAKSTSGKQAGTPEYTDEIKNTILKSKRGELISFHNHPASMPPSAADINAAFHNGYLKGYILCHDGKIYEYTAPDREVSGAIYDLRIADYEEMGYTEFEAQLEAMKYLSEMYGFVFKEVK